MAVDMFLKFIDIKGESTDSKHPGEIEILSWSWGETNTLSSGGERLIQDFHFTKKVDMSSPKLMLACAIGKMLTEDSNGHAGFLYVRKAGADQQVDYIKVTFDDVLVSSYVGGGHAGSALPTDQFSLNFAKIRFEYHKVNRDGSLGPAIFAVIESQLVG
jgi:type VI secretion system secreted protein Hcp